MNTYQLNDRRYHLQGSIQCSNENGSANRTFKVLTGTSAGANQAHSSIPQHAQVALQDGSGNIAYFTADQALQLANALTAAATDASDGQLKADC